LERTLNGPTEHSVLQIGLQVDGLALVLAQLIHLANRLSRQTVTSSTAGKSHLPDLL